MIPISLCVKTRHNFLESQLRQNLTHTHATMRTEKKRTLEPRWSRTRENLDLLLSRTNPWPFVTRKMFSNGHFVFFTGRSRSSRGSRPARSCWKCWSFGDNTYWGEKGSTSYKARLRCFWINNSLHLARKYARIFVRGHYLFREANSFPRAYSSRKTVNLQEALTVHTKPEEYISKRRFLSKMHQMFSVHTKPEELKNASLNRSVWICVWIQLGQGSHVIIVTSSFSKNSVSKMFFYHTEMKTRRLQIPPVCLAQDGVCLKHYTSKQGFCFGLHPIFQLFIWSYTLHIVTP